MTARMTTSTFTSIVLALSALSCTLDDPPAESEADRPLQARAIVVEPAASCPGGEDPIIGTAACEYSLNTASATGVSGDYAVVDFVGTCTCYVSASCSFDNTSSICPGGSLANGETNPCTADLSSTGRTSFASFTGAGSAGACSEGCEERYDNLDQASKDQYATDICSPLVPASTASRLSCCAAD
jgi:hypothetical protein